MTAGSSDRVEEPMIEGGRSALRSSSLVPGLALLWCLLTMLTVELDLGAVRSVAVLLFLATVPGLAVTGWLVIDDVVFEATLVLGIGAAVGIAIGEVLVWSHWWEPVVALWLLALACGASLALQLHRARVAKVDVGDAP